MRLGCVEGIATVVDDFVERVLVDPRLQKNPHVTEAYRRKPKSALKYHVTEMVAWATGGPQVYTGRSMLESHRHLHIAADEWEAFLDDLRQTLDHHKVPLADQKELFAILGGTRTDIVTT
jgi:hemoglobin